MDAKITPRAAGSEENGDEHRRTLRTEQSIATIAEESINRDLEDQATADVLDDTILSRTSTNDAGITQHSLASSHRRPSANVARPFLGIQQLESIAPLEQDRDAALDEERSLLRDNNLIPRKRSRRRDSQASNSSASRGLMQRIASFSNPRRKGDTVDEETGIAVEEEEPSETTVLLPNGGGPPNEPPDNSPTDDPSHIAQKWEDAILSGAIHTTWQREAKTLARYSGPLVFTYILQNSLTLTSIFTVGHIGKNELGAVSLGSMTANITGYAVYHGLATSLDTLCAQAYGSGRKKLVGLNLQRMVLFLWVITVPIAVVWFFATKILMYIVPEQEIAELAGNYLKVLILGAPGYAAFESAKRYVQAQGDFGATLYVLLIAAPLNILLHWLFVWHFQWGFIGCPIAVVTTETLMPILLALYVRFHAGLECWPGLTTSALRNWGPMVRLALPGLVMVMAEFLAFEILTLASANFSATHLAANTVLQSLSVFTYNFPFPLSIAGSTRIANLIGATLPDAAKVTTRVMFVGGCLIGLTNMMALMLGRWYIPQLFTRDADVIALAAKTLPVNAAFQLFDSLAAQCNGVMRGLGKQSVGGLASLFAFYGVALPISFGTGFGLHWELYGLWAGPAIGLFAQATTEGIYIYRTSWQKASEEAAARNAAG